MNTLRLPVDTNDPNGAASRGSIETAGRILRDGGTVAFPTETVYGLGANALRADAVESIFAAKRRPAWDPLIVHIADLEMLHRVAASVPRAARRLMDQFWPGPLTLLLPRHPQIPDAVTAGRARVGVRMPQHPVARALIHAAGVPVAAPSANTFGRTSPTLAQHVADDLEGRIDAILDADASSEPKSDEPIYGVESTVVDACEDPIVLYRPGAVTLEQIQVVCPDAVAFREPERASKAAPESLPSPGIGMRHYAPRARLVLVEYGPDQVSQFRKRASKFSPRELGLMLPDQFAKAGDTGRTIIYRWGDWTNPAKLAQRLFAGLRQLDSAGVAVIVCPLPKSEGIGTAIRDRLLKAARSE